MCMFGAFIFGSFNGVKFQNPNEPGRIYSFYSFSYPAKPYIHQMIVHRSMMAIGQYICAHVVIYMMTEKTQLALLNLMPIILAGLAFTYDTEIFTFT